MVFEIRNKFEFPHGKGIWVLVSDTFEGTRSAERFSQDSAIRSLCYYDDFVIQFNYGEYYEILHSARLLL